jgi:hypothetical protein
MADIPVFYAIAVGVQTALGTINAAIRDLDIDGAGVASGIVLGDSGSGDGNSGITVPNIEPVLRAGADLSLTRNLATFVRHQVANLQIDYQVKGNGAASTPTVGEALPRS